MKEITIKKEKLEHLYHDKLFSSRTIAKMCNCSQGVILRNLRKYHFPVRNPKKKIKIPKKELEEFYIERKLSTYKIAKLYNCDPKTIYYKLKGFGIRIRPRKKIKISKIKLKNLYFNKSLSLAAIGRLYNYSQVSILNKMEKYGFSRRKTWETNEKHPKYNFRGSPLEKSYLLGFRAGDLGVRQTSQRTGNIQVGCSSTKSAQIQLIKNLFRNYGPIWISKPNNKGVQSIDTLLNSSFSFLIPKKDKIYKWILEDKNCFSAYLAGYTDAEGSIGVYDGRARFRIGSYDIGILKNITSKLVNQGIRAILRLESPVGTVSKKGVIQRGNFWRITISEKNSLLPSFKLIGIYLKHSDRIRAMEKAIKNIKERNQIYH